MSERLPEILRLVAEVGETRLADMQVEAVKVRPVPPKLLRDLARARPPSPREMKVLELLADGRQQPEIAIELHVSTETVKTYMRKLRLRLGAHTQAQVVARAIQAGYLQV